MLYRCTLISAARRVAPAALSMCVIYTAKGAKARRRIITSKALTSLTVGYRSDCRTPVRSGPRASRRACPVDPAARRARGAASRLGLQLLNTQLVRTRQSSEPGSTHTPSALPASGASSGRPLPVRRLIAAPSLRSVDRTAYSVFYHSASPDRGRRGPARAPPLASPCTSSTPGSVAKPRQQITSCRA